MRLTFTALGRTIFDVAILEDDEEEPAADVTAAWVTVLDSIVHDRADGPAPFGFRPGPGPWPPDWE